MFRVALQGTLAETHRVLVATAKREHAKIMTADPVPSSFVRIVDGAMGAPEESVKPTGVIVYRYPRVEQVVQFAMETLFDLSPVLSGEYRNSHMLFINGVPYPNLKGWRPGLEISITNPVPYARKIEVGKMKMRVPGTDLVYQRARRKIMARYGNMVDVKFTYRAIVGGYNINQELTATRRRAATGNIERRLRPGAHNRSDVRFPVLVITER
ncbi:hypothetical protein [Mesorhizobium sp. M0968]|uniref:hypothetical protein n=1 Tax=Mesorhizobium sp. M0968 TaxID=2957037 RepID=UPI00333B85C2